MSNSVSRHETNHVPETVAQLAELMSGYPAPWALCGGWAIDAWLGRLTRDHGDVDVAVFVQDRQALRAHLSGWQLVCHDAGGEGDTSDLWNGRPIELPGHLHARPDTGEALPDRVDTAAHQGFGLDIQFSDRSGGDWVLSREPVIGLPLNEAVQESPWGLPAAVPEVLLFFKSQELRRRDKLDFQRMLPLLTAKQREWLRDAIMLAGHPWVPKLA